MTEVLYGAEVFQSVYKAIICQSLQADLEGHPVGEITIKCCEAALFFWQTEQLLYFYCMFPECLFHHLYSAEQKELICMDSHRSFYQLLRIFSCLILFQFICTASTVDTFLFITYFYKMHIRSWNSNFTLRCDCTLLPQGHLCSVLFYHWLHSIILFLIWLKL